MERGGCCTKHRLHHISTQDIWKNHPEKALVVNSAFATNNREDLKKVMKAIIEACKWLDVMSNRSKAASWLTNLTMSTLLYR
jgi:nitrate/nitrite transport system substrate-binding protein